MSAICGFRPRAGREPIRGAARGRAALYLKPPRRADRGIRRSRKRSDRPQLAAAMAPAKSRKATSLVAKLDRLSRSVAFIATLMDSKGFDLAIADMPGANRLTVHVL